MPVRMITPENAAEIEAKHPKAKKVGELTNRYAGFIDKVLSEIVGNSAEEANATFAALNALAAKRAAWFAICAGFTPKDIDDLVASVHDAFEMNFRMQLESAQEAATEMRKREGRLQ